ncbi:MAG: spondin domain-containing protein [Gammaproteobacteria bacterium]|nr:spondin domain-containing protein [Gammaproteobacteria bacterium]
MTKSILALALSFGLIANAAQAGDDMETFKITVTNGSLHQILTPPLVVAHKRGFHLYHVGQAASEGLGIQAETGDPSMLKSEAEANGMVYSSAVGAGVILPGQSLDIEIMAPRRARFSVSTMLAGSNDALAVVSGTRSAHNMMAVIDAGTEMNNEDCDYIPGPPCGNGSNQRTASGEGMVSYHNGVHGVGDLVPAENDWRGSFATVHIDKMDD